MVVANREETESVDFIVKSLFKMLGWRFAQDGPKSFPFVAIVAALGVTVDVSEMHTSVVSIENTEMRRAELSKAIQQSVDTMSLPKHDALRLRGRMQFAVGKLFGRVAKRCLEVVTQHAYTSKSPTLSADSVDALKKFLFLLRQKI